MILAVLDEAVNDLVAWTHTHWDADFAAREAYVLAWGRSVMATVLGGVVEAGRAPGRPPRCPHCQADAGNARRRDEPRQVLTQCGPIAITRQRAVCRTCHHSWTLPDGLTGVPARAKISPALRAWLVELGVTTTFREASALLKPVTGLVVSPETVRTDALAAGARLLDETRRDAAIAERAREPVGPIAPAPGQLLAEVDGVQVPYRSGWHEAKVGALGGLVDGTPAAVSYLAVRLPAEDFGRVLAAEAARRGAWEIVGWDGPVTGRGLARLRETVLIGDGAPWIWNLAAEHFGDRIEILDFYHASEHLHTLAKMVWSETDPAAHEWAQTQRGRLLTDGAPPVLAAIAALRPQTPAAREAKRLELGYFTKNVERMDYPGYRRQGLPIGSGLVESACKHVVQTRMKRAGMRWSDDGGDAMLALCARRATQKQAA
jgi:hypothetical protein